MLKQILAQKEDQKLEFKTSFGRECIETLVAFANAKGGRVFIGINNTPEIVGVSVSDESVQQWLNQIKSASSPSIVPDVEVLNHRGKQVVILQVPAYPVKPVSMKGKYFIRKYASNHLMSLEEIANEHLKTINLSWDFAQDPNHTIKDISLSKVNQFVEMANSLRDHPITDDPLTVLRKFELIREQGITFGCFLLFCGVPTLSTTIDAGRFDSETIIRDNLTIRDDLFSELDTVLNFIKKHISKRFVISGKAQRDEIWEYPLEAVREIALNMIVHRDYRSSADSTIKIFQNRIEFFNPGTLPPELYLEDILSGNSPSFPRNKQIAAVFKEAGIIEKYGSGIKRVRLVMQAADADDPLFEIVGGFFKVTLFSVGKGVGGGVTEGVTEGVEGVTKGVTEGVTEGVTKGIDALFALIQKNSGKRTPYFSAKLATSPKNIERWLTQLKQTGKIEFQGAPKTGGYFPTERKDT